MNKTRTVLARFAGFIQESMDGCRLWTGKIDRHGYGWFWLNEEDVLAHRTAWRLQKGEIPKGLCVLHKCDVRNCVNVEHLFLGTQADNAADMWRKGRGPRPDVTQAGGKLPYGVERTPLGRYSARIGSKKYRHLYKLGTFNTVEEAAAAAAAAREDLYSKIRSCP